MTNKVTQTKLATQGSYFYLHKQEGNKKATQAKLVTRATIQELYIERKY
jgi:hypothetical protein